MKHKTLTAILASSLALGTITGVYLYNLYDKLSGLGQAAGAGAEAAGKVFYGPSSQPSTQASEYSTSQPYSNPHNQ